MDFLKNSAIAVISLFLLSGCPQPPPTAPAAPGLNVLVFSKTSWYRHPEVPNVNGWLVALGAREGISVHVTETGADFTEKRLKHYQVVVLNNTTDIGKSLDEKQKAALKEWFQGGGGIVGLHAAAVHHNTWEWYTGVIGCDFDSDSKFVKARLTIDPAAKDHPSVAGRPASFWYTADWQSHDRAVGRGQFDA